jgi:hypothetical protein
MRRVFMTHQFSRWLRKTELTESPLCSAVTEMSNGLIGADTGGAVLKKRVAMSGRGKSGSAHTLLATNRASRWFFVFGFEKNERANVSAKEVEALQQLAADLLRLSPSQLNEHVGNAALKEICHDNQSQDRKQDP